MPSAKPITTSVSVSREAHARLLQLREGTTRSTGTTLRLLLLLRIMSEDAYHPPRGRGTKILSFKDSVRTPIVALIQRSGWRLSTVAESVLLDPGAEEKLAYWSGLTPEDRGTLLRTIWPTAYVRGEVPPPLDDDDLLAAP